MPRKGSATTAASPPAGQGVSPARRADVARLAGVSPATVSYVLNEVADQKISQATKDAVHTAAAQLGYVPNQSARSLALGRSQNLICVVSSSRYGESALRLLSALTSQLAPRGYFLAVYFGGEDQEDLRNLVRQLRPRLIFPLFGVASAGLRQAAGALAVPLIEMPVTARPDAGTTLQVRFLHERGHVRIGFAYARDEVAMALARHREATALAVCSELGLAPPLSIAIAEDDNDGIAAVERWRAAGVTAICAYNDAMAVHVIAAARQAGVACPDELAVIGYDGLEIGRWTSPAITTIVWNADQAAAAFAAWLMALLQPGDFVPDETGFREDWKEHVLIRGSA